MGNYGTHIRVPSLVYTHSKVATLANGIRVCKHVNTDQWCYYDPVSAPEPGEPGNRPGWAALGPN